MVKKVEVYQFNNNFKKIMKCTLIVKSIFKF
jgi:hypothetical protein